MKGVGVAMRFVVGLWSFVLVFAGCNYMPGTEVEDPRFVHFFEITYRGEVLTSPLGTDGVHLLFVADPVDLPSFELLDTYEGSVGEMVPVKYLLPKLNMSVEDYDLTLDDEDRLCLGSPIKFFDPESLAEVGRVDEGVCLGNFEKTVLRFDS